MQELRESPETSLSLSPAGALGAAARDAAGQWVLEVLPPWLPGSLGVSVSRWPLEAPPGHPLFPLVALAREVGQSGLPVKEFCLELESPDGQSLYVLVQAQATARLADTLPTLPPREGVLFHLRDVTEIVRLRRRTAAIGTFHGLVGQSLPMLEVFHKIATYGPTEAPVVITGETGSGKELVAKALHDRSVRAQNPFVAVNCMALSVELFESELFGHEKGSFTGAHRQHRGRFQRADTGTLFLDEIGDMPLMTQAKLLRALEEGVVERVGSEKEERVDVRVVAATNVALERAVQARRFRADLFHRLSVLRIHVPPLRERHGDLPLLVAHFLEHFNRRYSKAIRRLTPEAIRLMEDYRWPGNVRELRNVMERLVIETAGEAIGTNALTAWLEEREYLSPGGWNADGAFTRSPIIPEPPREVELAPAEDSEPMRHGDAFWGHRRPAAIDHPTQVIEAVPLLSERTVVGPAPPPVSPTGRSAPVFDDPVELTEPMIRDGFAQAKGNLTRTAALLGVHKATLYRHMKRLGLTREALEGSHGG